MVTKKVFDDDDDAGDVDDDMMVMMVVVIMIPRDQNSPKALYSMVFGPKILNVRVLRSLGDDPWGAQGQGCTI